MLHVFLISDLKKFVIATVKSAESIDVLAEAILKFMNYLDQACLVTGLTSGFSVSCLTERTLLGKRGFIKGLLAVFNLGSSTAAVIRVIKLANASVKTFAALSISSYLESEIEGKFCGFDLNN